MADVALPDREQRLISATAMILDAWDMKTNPRNTARIPLLEAMARIDTHAAMLMYESVGGHIDHIVHSEQAQQLV